MTDAPVRIYLQWMPGEGEVTWCVEEINEDDIEYTRKDIADKRIVELEAKVKFEQDMWGKTW